MSDIKTKKKQEISIKKLDRFALIGQSLKSSIVKIKEKGKEDYEKNKDTAQEYAEDRVKNTMKTSMYYTSTLKEKIIKAKENFVNLKNNAKIKRGKNKKINLINNRIGKITKVNGQIKYNNVNKQVKYNIVHKTINIIKKETKRISKLVKKIIQSINMLVSIILAGGWIATIVVIVVCLIGMICGSVFGIFFINEKKDNEITLSDVMMEVNVELNSRINAQKLYYPTAIYDVKYSKTNWQDIIKIYTVIVSNGDYNVDVMTFDTKRALILRQVFFDMNEIKSNLEQKITKKKVNIPFKGEVEIYTLEQILHINIQTKSIEEMANKYKFNDKQREQLKELTEEKYKSSWLNILNANDFVNIARRQVGNVGGEPYWRWYGFSERVEWCACFVSWCANEAGFIESGVIPKFANCDDGITWFKDNIKWQDKGNYIPKASDIIFFDWNNDNTSNHVGIVEKVENEIVFTIEGNSDGDMCRQKEYNINSDVIMGYGIIEKN